MRRGTRMLPKLGLLVAALSLALAVAISSATPLHSEPGDQIAVQEANFSEPVAVERPVAVAKGFENAEPPNIRPEPAVPPELRNQKPDPPKTATPSAPELEKAAQRKAERERAKRRKAEQQRLERQRVERQEAKRQKAEQRELERQEAERRKAERQEAERQEAERREAERREIERRKAEAEREKAGPPSTRRVLPLPAEAAGSSQTAKSRPDSAGSKPGVRRPVPRGGKMSLSIKEIGLRNSEIETTDEQRALDRGLIHLPQTSRPWERGEARNVYVVGHRMGWPDTGSWKIFYRLDELQRNDRLVLTAGGETYRYRVTEKFVVTSWDVWVTDPVKGRDLLTLQTCTGPNFSQRLIIRADRV